MTVHCGANGLHPNRQQLYLVKPEDVRQIMYELYDALIHTTGEFFPRRRFKIVSLLKYQNAMKAKTS